jgi:hypothetical protein
MKQSARVGRTSAHQFLVISFFLVNSVTELSSPKINNKLHVEPRESLAKQCANSLTVWYVIWCYDTCKMYLTTST